MPLGQFVAKVGEGIGGIEATRQQGIAQQAQLQGDFLNTSAVNYDRVLNDLKDRAREASQLYISTIQTLTQLHQQLLSAVKG